MLDALKIEYVLDREKQIAMDSLASGNKVGLLSNTYSQLKY